MRGQRERGGAAGALRLLDAVHVKEQTDGTRKKIKGNIFSTAKLALHGKLYKEGTRDVSQKKEEQGMPVHYCLHSVQLKYTLGEQVEQGCFGSALQ